MTLQLNGILKDVLARADQFAERYRGKVASLSATELAEAQTATEALSEQFGRLIIMPACNGTQTRAMPHLERCCNVCARPVRSSSKSCCSSIWNGRTFPKIHVKIVDDPALARWRHYLLKALDMRPHLLSEPEEKILAEKAVTGSGAWHATTVKCLARPAMILTVNRCRRRSY